MTENIHFWKCNTDFFIYTVYTCILAFKNIIFCFLVYKSSRYLTFFCFIQHNILKFLSTVNIQFNVACRAHIYQNNFSITFLQSSTSKRTIKAKWDNYGLRKPQLLWTDRTYSPAIDQFRGKKIPLIFSADFEALKSLPSLKSQSLPFMGGHQISAAIQEKSPGFACAAEISRPAEGCILVALCCYLSAPLRT